MIKKNTKKIFVGIYFLVLVFGFFYLSAVITFAADLEVDYPPIAGQTLTSVTKLPDFMLYLFNAGITFGFFAVFVSLVMAGVFYVLSPAKPDLLANAKDRVSGAISGLLILILTYLIITTINPELKNFTFKALPAAPAIQAVAKSAPGVYFYTGACPDKTTQPNTQSISDLGKNLKNKVTAVDIQQDANSDNSYISILYENPGFWGKCFYVSGNTPCKAVTPFAQSASIYQFTPNADDNGTHGVYFYRKSCFNDKAYSNVKDLINHCNATSGGYLEISDGQINTEGDALYSADLEQLEFTGVPDDEKKCIKYDATGKCTSKETPTLDGENISSMIINGNYLVLLAYKAPSDPTKGPWTSCQEFPTSGDINKLGPRQIKWQNIRNSSVGVVPNFVIIIPI